MSLPPKSENVKADGRTTLELGGVLPKTAEVRDGHLFIGGVDMVKLARVMGTALYVVDEDHFRSQLEEYLTQVRANWQDSDVVYAGKALATVGTDKIVAEEGCCLDVSSGGELALAQAAGFPMERIVEHGNNKTVPELEEALDAGVGLIVVDTHEELERISRLAVAREMSQKVLVRVTPGVVADTHAYIQTGAEDSKFGFSIHNGQAMEALKLALSLPGVELAGLHMHIGSQIFDLSGFAAANVVAADFMAQVKEETGYEAGMLDLGGGLGISYQAADKPSTIAEYAQVAIGGMRDLCQERGLKVPHLMVEPGRSVVANAGVTLYTVGSVKEIPGVRTWVAIDGGMTDNIRTALYGASYEAVVANKADQPRTEVATICGKHCESGDVIIYDASLQPVEPGDTICVFTTGAYNHTMASNYNAQVRPAMVLVRDGKPRTIIRRETYQDLLAREIY